MALLVAMVTLALTAFQVATLRHVGSGKSLVTLPGLALALCLGLVLGCAPQLCTFGLLGNHVDELRNVNRFAGVPAGNGERIEGLGSV